MAGLATCDGGKALTDVVNCRAIASAAKAQNQQNETQENKPRPRKLQNYKTTRLEWESYAWDGS
jgi:hypothetical protein